ncbi:lectin-like protein [Calothrix sp. PCC 6303]|uniref:lectin-like protein n=1 Tax=Calothrix sp. PCC 6303 TaxID=1170562 RepID=UPI0002A054F1|nr:lectin-like protein [Calothrix sp. PCC 6303]AFZ00679.1 FG-GAP repeat protein [Calothrix sp. PCC 6303]
MSDNQFSASSALTTDINLKQSSPLAAAVGTSPVLAFTSNSSNYTPGSSAQAIASSLTITGGSTINGARVSITSDFNSAQDTLAITGSIGSLTANYDSAKGILTISGAGTAADYQNALRQVTYSNSNTTLTNATRNIQFSLGELIANPGNGNYYKYVSNSVSYQAAKTDVESSNQEFLGIKGYLATITSDTEQAWAQQQIKGVAWLGGSDAESEGQWKWIVGGVEKDTQFSTLGVAVSGKYVNWHSGEPNGTTNQNALVMSDGTLSSIPLGQWADVDDGFNAGYLIEYEASGLQLSGNITLTLNNQVSKDIYWRDYTSGDNSRWQVIGSTDNTGKFSVKLGDKTALFEKEVDLNWQMELVSDFDKDGVQDLFWYNAKTGEASVWKMKDTATGLGLDKKTTIYQVGDSANWKVQGLADFNNDGVEDILWRNYATGENGVWLMNQETSNGGKLSNDQGIFFQSRDTNWAMAGVADLDNNGSQEIVWRNSVTGENNIWSMQHGGVSNTVPFGTISPAKTSTITSFTDSNWNIVGVGDFTGDGKKDLIWNNSSTGENEIWQMKYEVTGISLDKRFTIEKANSPKWSVAGVSDFNGDGITDVAWRNYDSGESELWIIKNATSIPVLDQKVALYEILDPKWKIEDIV